MDDRRFDDLIRLAASTIRRHFLHALACASSEFCDGCCDQGLFCVDPLPSGICTVATPGETCVTCGTCPGGRTCVT